MLAISKGRVAFLALDGEAVGEESALQLQSACAAQRARGRVDPARYVNSLDPWLYSPLRAAREQNRLIHATTHFGLNPAGLQPNVRFVRLRMTLRRALRRHIRRRLPALRSRFALRQALEPPAQQWAPHPSGAASPRGWTAPGYSRAAGGHALDGGGMAGGGMAGGGGRGSAAGARGSAAGRAPGRGSGVAADDAEEEEEERRRAAGELLADFAQNAASSSSTSPPRSRTDLSDSPETKHSRLPPQPLAVPSPDGCNADGWPSHPGKRPKLLSSSESAIGTPGTAHLPSAALTPHWTDPLGATGGAPTPPPARRY